MIGTPPPEHEASRIAVLRSFDILDTPSEQGFDDLTFLASQNCDAPIALISFVDTERVWYKSRCGVVSSETPRAIAFCSHTILSADPFIIRDTLLDPRFANNPLVTSPSPIRFYAGHPLVTASGHALGTICVMDYVPRELTAVQITALAVIARQIMALLDLRIHSRDLQEARNTLLSLSAERAKKERGGAPILISSSWSILVAEDNPVIQKLVFGQIQSLGHSVDFANDGEEAVRFAETTGYDLILMDCQMPHIDGFEATRRIRKFEGDTRHTPIVAVTAHVQKEDRDRCIEAGMDNYITKPVRFGDLRRIFDEYEIPILTPPPATANEVGGINTSPRLNPATIESLVQLKILDEVVDLFLADTVKRLETLSSALASNFANEARTASHSMKGSALNIGAEEFAKIVGSIEDLIRKKKLKEASGLLPELENEFREARVALHTAVRNR